MNEQYTEVYEKLSRLQWLLGRRRMQGHSEHGPFADSTRGQGRVLAALKIQPEISTKDLSYLLGIRVPSLNELLVKMEKGGFVERRPSEADRRVMIIHLTEKGKQTEQREEDYGDIFGGLGEEELSAFGQYLDRVIEALEERVGAVPDEEEMAAWMHAARSRMGSEQFGKMMAMRGGCMRHGGHHGHHGHGGHHGHHGGHGCGHHSHHGHQGHQVKGFGDFEHGADGGETGKSGRNAD